ncbi:MAG: DUF3237 family protein [Lachnospiraceae bacterium]|nr:DUF3237 family protein [Lachnospiraceae bacterium]
MEKKPIMDLKIDFNGPVLKMQGEVAEVVMIPFKGSVKSDIFNGIIEPCGVDTQVVNAAHVRHMSARYMLTGKDNTGADAHIFVENNGWFDDTAAPAGTSFRTVPTFYTDSAALAPYLHSTRFSGEGSMEEDGLHIRFYEV